MAGLGLTTNNMPAGDLYNNNQAVYGNTTAISPLQQLQGIQGYGTATAISPNAMQQNSYNPYYNGAQSSTSLTPNTYTYIPVPQASYADMMEELRARQLEMMAALTQLIQVVGAIMARMNIPVPGQPPLNENEARHQRTQQPLAQDWLEQMRRQEAGPNEVRPEPGERRIDPNL